MAYPTKLLMLRAERVLIYLYTRKSRKIKYTRAQGESQAIGHWAPTAGMHFNGHSDASFEVSRSTSGYIFLLAGGAVLRSWLAPSQHVRLSSCADYSPFSVCPKRTRLSS